MNKLTSLLSSANFVVGLWNFTDYAGPANPTTATFNILCAIGLLVFIKD